MLTHDWVVVFGTGRIPLPLVLADNAVAALALAADTPGIGAETFNIVDDERLTQREYRQLLEQCNGGMPRVVHLPRAVYYGIGLAAELAAFARGKQPQATRYSIRSRLALVQLDCSKAKRVLRWQPSVPLRGGLASIFRAAIPTRSPG